MKSFKDAENYEFYWQNTNRTFIEEKLNHSRNGTFIVREASDKSLCLSLKYEIVLHLKFVVDEDGIVRIGHGNRSGSKRSSRSCRKTNLYYD